MTKIRDVLRPTNALGMSRRMFSEATGIGRTGSSEPHWANVYAEMKQRRDDGDRCSVRD